MMRWQYTPYVLPLLIAAAISAAVAALAWRRRPTAGATPLFWGMLAATCWSLAYALELAGADLATKLFWLRIEYLGIATVAVAWLLLVLEQTGWEKWLTRRNRFLLSVVPAITILLAWTNDDHGLIYSHISLDTNGSFPELALIYGVWFWISIAYSYVALLFGTLLLLRVFLRASGLYRGQARALLIGASAPWLVNILHLSGLSPFPHLDLTPFAFTLTGLASAWALFRFRLLDIVPVARGAVIESMDDGVIVLDSQDRVVDFNPSAARITGRLASEVIGEPAAQALPDLADLIQRYRDVTEAHEEISLGLDEAECCFDLRISPLRDRRGRITGRLLVLHDITERKQAERKRHEHEQFLALLNDITRAALDTPDLPTMAQILADRLGELFNADGCYITLWDEEAQMTRPVAAYGAARDAYRSAGPKPGELTVTESVLRIGRPLLIEDVYDTPYLDQRIADLFPDRSLLGLPLLAGGQMKGAALIAFNEPHQFTPEEVARGEQVAEHIALAMAKAWSLETERAARERIEALYRVARSLITLEDLETQLQSIVDSVAEALPADRVTLIVLDLEADQVGHFAKGGAGAQQVVSVSYDELQDGLTGWVLREQKPTLSPQGRPDPRESPAVQRRRAETNCGAIIVVPLMYRGEPLGTMTAIGRPDQPDFGEQDLDLMMAMAYQAVIGIENARLVAGLEEEVAVRTAEIRTEQEKSETILRSVADAIMLIDLEMRIQYVNDAFTSLTGYAPKEVLGKHASRVGATIESEQMRQSMIAALAQGKLWQGEASGRRKDGRNYDAALTIAPVLDGDGRLAGYVSSHQDVSQQKDMERARGRFMTNVSHELRTPLTNIKLYTQLLQRGVAPEKIERHLRVLDEQVDRLAQLVQDILEMTALDSGPAGISSQPISFSTIIQDAISHFQDRARAAGLNLISRPIPPDLPATMGDQARLGQALGKLVENAVTFVPMQDRDGGQVTIEVGTAEADGQSWITIAVQDTGPGISAEEQERIFDRFFRGRLAESGHVPGTGLGLSMVQEILRAHGGRVTVESSGVPGEGSTFTLWLPTVS
jgi:PAS domain S-box-containing protein